MILTEEQEKSLSYLKEWSESNIKYGNRNIGVQTTLGGLAGTGKTTLITQLRKELSDKLRVAFVSFTGKASLVLKTKLETYDVLKIGDFVGTIHKLIYKPLTKMEKGKEVIVGWRLLSKDEIFYDLIIIDEASMITEKIWNDICSFNIPIIAIGDHGQLPPVGDNFSLMRNPDIKLTEIHRQALDHPIIKLSKHIREHGYIPFGILDENKLVCKFEWNKDKICNELFEKIDFCDENLICLCGANKTRNTINTIIRKQLGNTRKEPYPNEKLICLQNNYDDKVFNGQIGRMSWLTPYFHDEVYNMTIDFGYEDGYLDCLVSKQFFGKEKYDGAYEATHWRNIKHIVKKSPYNSVNVFDYGYCITVHKSQGSEWDKVILFEERPGFWDDDFYNDGYIQQLHERKRN